MLGHITGRILEEGGTSEAPIQREQTLKQVEKDPGDDCGFQVKHAHRWKLRGNGCGSGLELQVPGCTPQGRLHLETQALPAWERKTIVVSISSGN